MQVAKRAGLGAYLSMIKFSHTVFALPFACIGFSLAVSQPPYSFSWKLLLLMVLCMVFARSAAMAFNRWLDRRFDALNPRTQNREIPAGTIAAPHALTFTVLNCLLFVACTYFINPLCFYLAPVALFVILFYSYTKRFTALCHLVLGLGLSLAPIGAYLAVTGEFHMLPLVFSFVVLLWVAGFDIIYSLQDVGFDKSQQLHSIPVLLGIKNALLLARVLHFGVVVLLVIAGMLGSFHFIYWIGALVFSALLFYQHWLVRPHDLSKVNQAFMQTNGIGSVVFAVCTIVSLFFSVNQLAS